ncbi:hypothetical protein SAMN05216389_104142 [Oceanobacillus limi]|uniref:Transporter n=1 Tax=Oceanobacillus limi TaxID=930131 RepID=A0A1I0B2V3_9BACI|nr:hypothetical protein [Oceanobacillus limi]SET00674.1 hypothetical protein SAMN05216389_104142 [Oceanobacillus limi]
MNPYEQSHTDERYFNFPGYWLGQFFGYPNQPGGGQFPWQPGGQFPGGGQTGGQFPGGGQPGGGAFPGFPGGQFPSQPGGGPQQGGGAPTSPPPGFTPQQPQFQTFAVDPGAIRGCLFRFTYVWLDRGGSFWFYPTFVGRNSISGFRWQRNRWVYFGIDLDRIDSFQCY